MTKYPKTKVLLILIIVIIITTGCWDKVEIEDVGIVIGMSIDKLKASSDIEITQQFINPSKEKMDNKKQYINMTNKASTIMQAITNSYKRLAQKASYEHLGIIILGEEFAKSNLSELDIFFRTRDLRRTTTILIARGFAKDIMDFRLEQKSIPSLYLTGISQNSFKTNEVPQQLTLGELSKAISGRYDVLCQCINLKNKNIGDSAIIGGKDFKLKGFLNNLQTANVNFLLNNKVKGTVKIKKDKSSKTVIMEILDKEIKVSPKINNNKVNFDIKINLIGKIAENLDNEEDSFEKKYIEEIKSKMEQAVKIKALNGFYITQKYKADIFRFWKQVEITNPEFWKKNKDNWDKIFNKATAKVTVDIKFREFGSLGSKYPKKINLN